MIIKKTRKRFNLLSGTTSLYEIKEVMGPYKYIFNKSEVNKLFNFIKQCVIEDEDENLQTFIRRIKRASEYGRTVIRYSIDIDGIEHILYIENKKNIDMDSLNCICILKEI